MGVRDNESMMTQMPTASRISGTEVVYGSTVRLQCETPGAVIYYTLDGSCPCDNEANRMRYDGPITIISDMVLKAVAIAPGYAESDVATFVYKLWQDPSVIYSIKADGTSEPVYTLEGVRIRTDKPLGKGVYVRKGDKIVVR